MIKKIAVNSLKVGMYIHDLDASWMSHPFLRNRFPVDNQKVIDEVLGAGIKHVYIDTERGLDFEMAVPIDIVKEEIAESKQRVADEQAGLVKEVSFESELVRAQSIVSEAHSAVRGFMQEVRFGKQIEKAAVDEVVDDVVESIFRNQDALITLSRIKSVDQYTYMHSISVCVLMTAFARAMAFDADTIRQISVGALLHDIGKMRVSSEILNKPGKLNMDEFQLMKCHVDLGEELLAEQDWMSELSLSVVREHHERIDGSGYPKGLAGDEISEVGRMAAIVDVYDALTSNRCYKKSWEPTYTLGKMLEWSRDHFGEVIAHQFVRCVGIYPVGTLVRLNSGMIAVVVDQHEDHLLQPRVRVVFNETAGRGVEPEDVELADSEDSIADAVSPNKLRIDPMEFL